MDREEIRNAIMDAFILQGQIDTTNKQGGELEDAIAANEAELKKLKVLEEETAKLKAERDKATKSLFDRQTQLNKLMQALEKEGVSVPVIPQTPPTHVRF